MVFDDMFRVNLYRSAVQGLQIDVKPLEKYQRSIGETSEKHRKCPVTELNDTQIQILELLSRDAQFSAAKLAEHIGVAGRNVEANIKKLKERGILIRHGSPKNGYWEIVQNGNKLC